METDFLKHTIRRALALAKSASDPARGALMDRTDFQQVVAQLTRMLAQAAQACDDLERDRRSMAERLTRNPTGCDPSLRNELGFVPTAATSAPSQ